MQDAVGLDEAHLEALVRGFYTRARQDPVLGPVFAVAVTDWEHHLQVVTDFWSRILLGSQRYFGSPYTAHMRLPLQPAHFDRWLALFREAAADFLPPDAAVTAVAKAEMMAASFKAGLEGASLSAP
ncbi:group III truncated hemoglobin [Zoogloea dura]|jgi:hemoglobin|uniref:Group III truncated hemoglobin n=1 Tax=Zoogloea dura TaxID=2728840 RepID=A0A848G6P1_9RHOO|nr:group III truncated hemoglobin [Zoogloea dura]NML26920.1 group III truncated hemoglobin [Zoogloea dura]